MREKCKVLVIEDNESIREALRDVLEERYDVLLAADGIDGLKMAIENDPDLILLDIMMPRLDGFLTCEALRQEETTCDVPIIMVTAMRSTKERIQAFKVGADDYIPKPFDREELLARIEAKLQRFEQLRSEARAVSDASSSQRACGNLNLNRGTQEASINGQMIHLSALEFKLVSFLVENRERLCSREEIIAAVWDSQDLPGRILDPHILTIRRKLDGFDHVIRSVYGGGYVLRPSREQLPVST